jgi:hypothetical protein
MRDLLDAHTKSGIMGNVGLREYGLHGLRLAPTASARIQALEDTLMNMIVAQAPAPHDAD